VGAESADAHHERLGRALAPHAIPRWPFAGLAAIRERSLLGDRTDLHVIRDWCWLGTAQDDGELGRLIEAPPRPAFDADIARLLIRTFAKGKHEVLPLARASGAEN
jgi:DNA polymerase-3 subunit epsilon